MKDQTNNPAKADKTSGSNARGIAFILLIPAILSLICAVWMAFQTMGTNLLFVTASRGQLYRQYPVCFVIGLILLLVAVLLLRANPAQTKKEEVAADESASAAAEGDELVAKEITEPISVDEDTETKDTAEDPISPEQEEQEEQEVQEENPVDTPEDGAAQKCFCTNCGAELAPESKFCIKCGTPVPSEAKQP